MKNLVLETRFFRRLTILCKNFQEKCKISAGHFSSYVSTQNRLGLNKKESAMKILKKITLGLIATAALALPMGANNAQAAGAEQSTPLAGQLVDVSTGRPISQVTVTITSDLTRYFLGHDVTVVTDANGRFSVDAPSFDRGFSVSIAKGSWCAGKVQLGQPNLNGLAPRLVNYRGFISATGSKFAPQNLGAIAVRPIRIGC